MDKAVIERSGHIAGGIDHFLAYMDTGAEWDTREAYLEFTGKSARGVTNIDGVTLSDFMQMKRQTEEYPPHT